MENKLIIANHKMNMVASDLNEYIKKINEFGNSNVIICPTSIYIPYFLKKSFEVGIQNTYSKSNGTYTGEVSPSQISSLGVKYTILGHSERRQFFEESNSFINEKVIECLNNNLNVILCIGENLEEKNLLKTNSVLQNQLVECLKNVNKEDFKNVIIAYEPIW